MKILIWIACAFVLSLITVSLKYAGVLLGFIPTFILGSLMFWSARTLCKKWDERKRKNKKILNINQDNSITFSKNDVYILIAALSIPILVCVHIIMECSGFDIGIFFIITDGMAFFILPIVFVVLIIKNKSICNITLNVLSVLSIFAALSSTFLQDPEKCIQEIMNPTIFYVFIIVVNVALLIGGKLKKIKHIRIIQSLITFLLAIASAFAMYEGSVFSSSTKSWNGVWNFYKNADLVFAIDMFWFVSSFVMCALTLLPLMIRGFQNTLQKYYSSMKYREKCYRKVANMQSYLEKGIITQEEFEKNKRDILKKIKSESINYSSKSETVEDKIVKNREETVKPVIAKVSTPLVSDDICENKVETVKIGEPSSAEWENLYKSDFEKFWEMVLEEYDLSKMPDRIMSLRDDTMFYGDEAREVYLSRLKGVVEYSEWMKKNHPEVINNQWSTIKELKKELQEKTSGKVYMLDVIRNYENKYIRY